MIACCIGQNEGRYEYCCHYSVSLLSGYRF
jgi:hypothetical protein